MNQAPNEEKQPRSGNIRQEDRVDLSPAAQALLAEGATSTGAGKSAQSPAHRARALIASHPELANLPFGKVVSGLNHGTLVLDPVPIAEDESPAEPGDAETTAVEPAATDGATEQDSTVALLSDDEGVAATDPVASGTAVESALLDALNEDDRNAPGEAV